MFPFGNLQYDGGWLGLGALTSITPALEDLPLAGVTNFKLSIVPNGSPNLAQSMGVLFQELNNSDILGGQTDVYSEGSNVAISGRTGPWVRMGSFRDQLLNLVGMRIPYASYDLQVDIVAPPSTTPNNQNEPDDPVDQDGDQPSGSGSSSGNGSGSGVTTLPSINSPSIPSKIFGIPTWLIAVGGGALLLYKGGK